MLNLGQKQHTKDLGKTLQGQRGIFEAKTPNGETLRIECKPDHSIVSLTSVDNPLVDWEVTKISEAEEARAAGQKG